MKLTFEPTKKTGRFFYRIFGKASFLRHPDGRAASDQEADAMAQGYIPFKRENVEESLALIESHRDTERSIWQSFLKWQQSAKPWEYGAESVWQEFEIRRSADRVG